MRLEENRPSKEQDLNERLRKVEKAIFPMDQISYQNINVKSSKSMMQGRVVGVKSKSIVL